MGEQSSFPILDMLVLRQAIQEKETYLLDSSALLSRSPCEKRTVEKHRARCKS